MKSSHRFPLRRQIVWGMRFFTILTSLAVGAALFILSNQYVRANSLQAAEFNLRLVATSIETSLDSADALLNWASIDSTVRRYISQENINGTQTIAAYEAVQEKYYSSTLYSHILRFFITNENDRHLQFGTLNSSAALNRTSIKQFLPKGYGMQFTTDPLLPGSPDCIALSQPVRCGKGTLHRGRTYLALDTAIITDPAAGYNLTDGSALYWEMGSRLWQIENGSLTEIENPLREVDYTLRTGSNNGVTEQTAWQGKVRLDGQKYYVVKVTLNGRSAALVQLLPANTFLLHYGVYLWLVALGIAIIWGLSFLMQHWLERVITHPVEALQKRIETVGSGSFAPDRTVEWNNELGDIGRGINQLAENVDSLMTRRVEDERRKQELEYRMLQNEVNPHFIYNTLNSIRWMATIQHAPGIAEMVTAFARLTKSISKGTQKLVPLQEELALLNDYFTIQQYRYGGDLEIEVSRIESETLCRDCMIPRFTLQPLVENAIFHGLEPKGGHGSVLLDISTDPDTGDVLLRITDDGVGMPPEQVAHLLDEPAEGAEKAEKFRHVGLWNVNRRIRYSFGEGYGLTIESEEDVGTEVTIRLTLARTCRERSALPAFIMLTSFEEFGYIKQAMGAGVVDYLVKLDLTPENLQTALAKAAEKVKKERALLGELSAQENLAESVRSYQERFFVRLYAGLFPDEAALEQPLQHMELNLASDAYLVASCEIIANTALTPAQQLKLSFSCGRMLETTLQNYLPCYVTGADAMRCNVLFCLTDAQCQNYRTVLRPLLERASQILYNYFTVRLLWAVGRPTGSLLGLARCCRENAHLQPLLTVEQPIQFVEVNEGDATAGKMQVVAQVQEYIQSHLSERLTLADVAAVFNFSPNYLSQLFGKYGDSGFVEYITETRIAAAKEMLEQGDLKVYEIAEKLGYESAFYFSKVFKKVTGLSPREYQQSI